MTDMDPEDWFAQGSMNKFMDPESPGQRVEFRANMVLCDGGGNDYTEGQKYPLAIYFPGLAEKPDIIAQMAKDWPKIAPEPFILVAAYRPDLSWWFIDDGRPFGWTDGSLRPEKVKLFCNWLKFLSDYPCVDRNRIGIFGFSAGAYACVELIARSECIPLSGVGLGGVHGHGNRNTEDLPMDKKPGSTQKFDAFLHRVRNHRGVPFIEATHGITDQESKFAEAQEIFQALSEQQLRLGLKKVSVRELAPEQQDKKPSKKTNRTHHNYFHTSFFRKDFLIALFGGPHPPPPKPPTPTEAPAHLIGRHQKHNFKWDAGEHPKHRWWTQYPPMDVLAIAQQFVLTEAKGCVDIRLSDGKIYQFDFEWMRQKDKLTGQETKIKQFVEDMTPEEIRIVGGGSRSRSRSRERPVFKSSETRAHSIFGAPVLQTMPTKAHSIFGTPVVENHTTEAGGAGVGVFDILSLLRKFQCPGFLSVAGSDEEKLNGRYKLAAENFDKPVYTKADVNNKVMLYFWDDRDGEDQMGWWFGSAIGGDEVFSVNDVDTPVPPARGWKVSSKGWAADRTMSVSA